MTTQLLQSLTETVDEFDVAVLDQWGVLHNGSVPYAHAAEAMVELSRHGKEIVIVSNSGKRAALNLDRISRMGLPAHLISTVVTSGEALWQDLAEERLALNGKAPACFYPVCGQPGDASAWAGDNDRIRFADTLNESLDAILLMGLPGGTATHEFDPLFKQAVTGRIPLICSNPDRTAPGANGLTASPGVLADRYLNMGGSVTWYGKPHAAIYRAVTRSFPNTPANRFLMVGDSMEHDVGGAQNMGFRSALIREGIHTGDFDGCDTDDKVLAALARLAEAKNVAAPDISLNLLK